MNVPILFLGHTVVTNFVDVAASLAFAKDTDETAEVELAVLAAETDSCHLNGQVLFVDGGCVLSTSDSIVDTIAVATFEVIDELCSRMGEVLAEALAHGVRIDRRRFIPSRISTAASVERVGMLFVFIQGIERLDSFPEVEFVGRSFFGGEAGALEFVGRR